MARPLTKRKLTGEVYSRPPSIEANIDGAPAEAEPALRRRLLVTDREDPGYLSSECLVHLTRHFTRLDAAEIRNAVVTVLLTRCEAILNARIAASLPNAQFLREEVLGTFALVLAEDRVGECPDELDYYEVKFNHAFCCLRIDLLRREKNLRKRTVPLPGESVDEDDEPTTVPDESMSCRPEQADGLSREDLLNRLPEEVRQAVVLCHEMGYEVESVDPSKVTAATLCGVTGRAIRMRLERAQKLLSDMNQEQI